MHCGQCGAEAQPGQRFCGLCGASLASPCPQCGHENPPDHRFCGSCGTQLTPGHAPAAQAKPAEAPSGTERRVVSVLFVDLVGFTTFSEHRDPEDVRELISDYFDLAREVIDRFGGTVDKYIGDAVMAWWGATTSNEDDAERAVRAGLDLVERVSALEGPGPDQLAARAAVMTGEVSVGPGGNERGLLLGDLVNSTSRLQTLAEPGTVYVGEETAALISQAIEVVPAGTHQVKGKDEPIVAARAVRVLSERGGRGRADTLEPPFVGRISELRLLKDSLHATGREHRARLVSLVGQAGIGKSRLIWEFQKYVDGLVETVYWHQGRSPAYGDGLALWALGEMIRRRAGIQETDPDETTATRLQASITDHIESPETARWVHDRLTGLLGLGESVATERNELFAAARAYFEGVAAKGTTVLAFEDLHWADPSLLEFIQELPDWSQNHPILVVTIARPELLDRRPDWGSGRRGFASVYLGPLADDEMTELISGAVPGIPDSATQRIVEAAGGVPLFAVEMLRTMLGDGQLVIEGGTVRINGDLESIEVPSSVQAVIAARLDRLPSAERDVIREVAVLGQSFTLDGLAALREEEPDKLERRLGDLVRHEILELVRDPRSPERGQYRWVQSVLREVAYGRISRADRHKLHLRAARYFRELADPELAPLAAFHYLAAADHGETDPELQAELVAALRAAIDRAQALHAYEQILSLVEAALPVVPDEIEIELREIAAIAAVRLNDLEAADLHSETLMEIADASDDPSLKHRAVALFGLVANETRRADRAMDVLTSHLEAYPDLHSDPNLARAAVYLARAQLLTGDGEGAAAIADDALGAVERWQLIDEIADAMVTRGTVLAKDRVHQGMALLRGALAICEEHELVATKLRALINIGYASPSVDESVAATKEAFEEAKRVGDRNRATFVAGNLFGDYMVQLDLDAAEELLADPIRTDAPHDRLHHLINQAALFSRRGHTEASAESLTQARELAAEISDTQAQLNLERTEATIGLVDGDYQAVFATGRRHFRDHHSFAPWASVSIALHGAAMIGDEQMLTEVREMAATLPAGSFSMTMMRWSEAILNLTTGDVKGSVELVDTLQSELAASGMRMSEFVVLASMARHLPSDHEARERYRVHAHDLATAAGAQGLVDWLERATAR